MSSFSCGTFFVRKCHLLSMIMGSLLLFTTLAQSKKCTSLRAIQKTVPAMCQESYQARCGWFTLKMCTFYEKVPCSGKANMTKVTQYKIITECCPGYKYDEDRITCIRNESDVTSSSVTMSVSISILNETSTFIEGGINATEITTTEKADSDVTVPEVEKDDDGFEFSHGAFAAIACAGLFIICVTIVIIIHVRKKQLKEEKKVKKVDANPMELQKMVQA